MSAPVFLAESSALGGYAPGSTYLLDGPEGRHAGVVQRRRVGEKIDVVDGLGTRLECTITAVDQDRVTLHVDVQTCEPVAKPRLVLVQALAKGDRDEMAIEAATEVGADTIIPWQAARSIVVWRGDRAAKSRARWLATVRAAGKQCRRDRVPEVESPLDLGGLIARTERVCASGGAVLILHEEAHDSLASCDVPAAGSSAELLVIVGPEGGISQAEVDALVEAGAQCVRLGPHVLRTSTAGPVAIALLAQRLGHWA